MLFWQGWTCLEGVLKNVYLLRAIVQVQAKQVANALRETLTLHLLSLLVLDIRQ